MTIEVGMLKM